MRTNNLSGDELIFIVGLGSYLPGDPIDNSIIAERLPHVPVFELMRYFGVEQRHFVVSAETGQRIEPGLGATEMAYRATCTALADAGLTAQDVDLIITTTATPDVVMPPLARCLQRRMDVEKALLYDLRGGCAAAIQGLILAQSLIRSGRAKTAVVCGSECMSPHYYAGKLLNNSSPNSNDMINALIFGDGAAAMVVQGQPAPKARSAAITVGYCNAMAMYPQEKEGLLVEGNNDDLISVETTHNHKLITRLLPEIVGSAVRDLILNGGRRAEDYRTLIVPQANRSLIEMIAPELVMGLKELMFYIGDKTANIPGAAMIMALDFAVKNGRAGVKEIPVAIVAAETASWTYAVVDISVSS